MKRIIMMLLYMLVFINRTILGETATAPGEISQQTNILFLVVPVLIVLVAIILIKSGKKTDLKADSVKESSADKDEAAVKQSDGEQKKQPVSEKTDAGKKTQKNVAVQEKPEISPLSRLAALEAEAGETSESESKPARAKGEPAASSSDGVGKKTLKNKAVEAPPLAGRLAEVDKDVNPARQSAAATPEPEAKASEIEKKPDPMSAAQVSSPAAEPPAAQAEVKSPQNQAAGLIQPKERLIFALEGDGKPYEAQGNIIRVGRKKENQICIPANEVSREHIEVTASKGLVYVMPLTETNTTRLNGRSVKEKQVIKPGDTLNLGGLDFIVVKARAL